MATIDVVLTDLTFPAHLEDKYCKFRLLISLRYSDSNGATIFAREALPGLGKHDYWECEKGNKHKPEYVRSEVANKLDTDKLDQSRREIVFKDLDLATFERLEVEILDVDVRSGFLDALKENVVKVLPVAVAPFIPATLPLSLTLIKAAVEEGTGEKVSDLEKGVIDKALGKEDGVARSLWLHSQDLTNDAEQTVTIAGAGVHGDYSVSVEIKVR